MFGLNELLYNSASKCKLCSNICKVTYFFNLPKFLSSFPLFCSREFTVDHLPPFEVEMLPKDYIWTIAYAPDNVRQLNDVMQQVKTRLNTGILKSPLERECNFGTQTTTYLAT